ncbi:MAG: hypothetical protein ACP5G0_06930 [Desulfomonilia bacterium]
MTNGRPRRKKDPLYLEDITLTIPAPGMEENENLFLSNLFLGRYNEDQIMEMLEIVGITPILRRKGYHNLIVSILRQDNYTSRLFVNFDTVVKETRLIELIVREGLFRPKQQFLDGYDFSKGLSMMLIEWLALQDPRAVFSEDKPRLPGQEYPGLGGLKNIYDLLYRFVRSMGKDAIVDIPEYYHAAVIYSKMYADIYSRKYSFFSPVDAGKVQSMIRDLNDRPLADISFAIAFGCLVNRNTGEKTQWKPSEQIYPISNTLQRYFEDDLYKAIVNKTMEESRFSIDWERYDTLHSQGMLDAL